MSTIVIVKKNETICIAADSLTTFGSQKLSSEYDENPDKIIQTGDSYIGITGSSAHQLVLENLFLRSKKPPDFTDQGKIFEFFRSIHPKLKDEYFLNPQDGEDDPYESSQFNLVIVNAFGIFAVFDLREVHQFSKFWAIGSGSEYAIGAMFSVYDQNLSAEEIAEIGINAGIEFDKSSLGPTKMYKIQATQVSKASKSAVMI